MEAETEVCNVCRGKGRIFMHGGYTKADHRNCYRCHGEGEVPVGSQKRSSSPNRECYNKLQGMEELKNVEAV